MAPQVIQMPPGGQYAGLQSAPSMVAYPGANIATPYAPTTLQEAWDNHFSAFGAQDLDKILLDYDDNSVVYVHNNVTGSTDEFKGLFEVRTMFSGLFTDLS